MTYLIDILDAIKTGNLIMIERSRGERAVLNKTRAWRFDKAGTRDRLLSQFRDATRFAAHVVNEVPKDIVSSDPVDFNLPGPKTYLELIGNNGPIVACALREHNRGQYPDYTAHVYGFVDGLVAYFGKMIVHLTPPTFTYDTTSTNDAMQPVFGHLLLALRLINLRGVPMRYVDGVVSRSSTGVSTVKRYSHRIISLDEQRLHETGLRYKGSANEHDGPKIRMHAVRGHVRRLPDGVKTWVRSHFRGDPELGIITHEYGLGIDEDAIKRHRELHKHKT